MSLDFLSFWGSSNSSISHSQFKSGLGPVLGPFSLNSGRRKDDFAISEKNPKSFRPHPVGPVIAIEHINDNHKNS